MEWGTPPNTAAHRTAEAPADPYWPQPPPPVPDPPPAPAGGSTGPLRWLAAAVVGAVVATVVAVPLTLRVQPAPQPLRFEAEPSPVAAVADAVLPTVARVNVLTAAGRPGSGSAVIFRPDGHLLTNAHVVEDAFETLVTLPDGTTHDAEVVGSDTLSDLAVLQIPTDQRLPVPAFAENLPRIGDTAIAIGSPFGLEGSVTVGVISALHRTVPGPQTPLVDLLQTDAPINPGNSGGALVNAEAEVIGINTAILPGSPTAPGNIGIGFAIPITTALPIAEQLVERGFAEHPQLGVHGQPLDPRIAEQYGLPVQEGAVVVEVIPGSGADEAGLLPGDIITAVDAEPVVSMMDLIVEILRRSPGDQVRLGIVRDGADLTVEATLGASPPPE